MSDYGTDIADAPAEPVDAGADVSAPDTTDYADEPSDLAETPPKSDAPETAEAPPAEDLSEPVADESDAAPEAPVDTEEPVDLGEAPDTGDVAPEEPQDWQEGEVVDLGHDAAPDAPDEAEANDLGGADLSAPEAADARDIEAPADSDGEDLTAPDDAAESDTPTDDAPDGESSLAGDDSEPTQAESSTSDIETVPDSDLPEEPEVEPDAQTDVTDAEPELSVDELTEAARDEARPTQELRAEYDADVANVLGDDTPSDAHPTEAEEVPAVESFDPPEASDRTDLPADLGNSPENVALTSALADKGLSLEPVDRFDYSDNPVLGYRESAPSEDVAYAVNTWNDQIAPGIAEGATREDFAAYDEEHGLEGHQRLAGVYDYMLGDDAIRSGGEREDGSLDVTGGRHRLEQARLNGVQYLPVKK